MRLLANGWIVARMSGNASPLTGVHAPFSQYYVV